MTNVPRIFEGNINVNGTIFSKETQKVNLGTENTNTNFNEQLTVEKNPTPDTIIMTADTTIINGISYISSSSGTQISAAEVWTAISAAGDDDSWEDVAWSPELGIFVAVGDGGGHRVMTSTNGYTWVGQSVLGDNDSWRGVAWSSDLSLFVAVAGTGSTKVMSSPDGINWTPRTDSPGSGGWANVVWGSGAGCFVAVASGGDIVMRSTDGINWEAATTTVSGVWHDVTWSESLSLFVAIANSGNRSMSSEDGITWINANLSTNGDWKGVVWGESVGLFVAVAGGGSFRFATSSNGSVWTDRSVSGNNDKLNCVTYSEKEKLFVAAGDTGDRVLTSPDGINWTVRDAADNNDTWRGIAYAPSLDIFAAVGDSGDRVIISTITAIPYKAFDQDITTKWGSEATYSGGTYSGSVSTRLADSTNYTGEYLQFQFPELTTVLGFSQIGINTPSTTAPVDFKMVYANKDSNFSIESVSSDLATPVITITGHNFIDLEVVYISGMGGTEPLADGEYAITYIDANSFSVSGDTSDGASGGTVTNIWTEALETTSAVWTTTTSRNDQFTSAITASHFRLIVNSIGGGTTCELAQVIFDRGNRGDSFTDSVTTSANDVRYIDMSENGQMIIAADTDTIVVSHNYGNNFIATTESLSTISMTSINADGSVALCSASSGNIGRSTDGGLTWTTLGPAVTKLPAAQIQACVLAKKAPYAVISGSSNDISYSSDYGLTWTLASGNPSMGVADGGGMSHDGKYAYIFGRSLLIRSTDYGVTWSTVSGTFDSGGNPRNKLAISATGKYIAVANNTASTPNDGSVYISKDYGETFTINDYLTDKLIVGVAMSYDGSFLIAINDDIGHYYLSYDFGDTWVVKVSNSNWFGIGTGGLSMSGTGNIIVMGTDTSGYIAYSHTNNNSNIKQNIHNSDLTIQGAVAVPHDTDRGIASIDFANANSFNIANLNMDTSRSRAFEAMVSVHIDRTTTDLVALFTLIGTNTNSWVLNSEYIGDDTAVTFAITTGGVVSFTHTTDVNFTNGVIKSKVLSLDN